MKFGFLRKGKKEKEESFPASLARFLYLKKELEEALEKGLVTPDKRKEAEDHLFSMDYALLRVEELAKKDFFTSFSLETAKNMAAIAPPGQSKLILLILREK